MPKTIRESLGNSMESVDDPFSIIESKVIEKEKVFVSNPNENSSSFHNTDLGEKQEDLSTSLSEVRKILKELKETLAEVKNIENEKLNKEQESIRSKLKNSITFWIILSIVQTFLISIFSEIAKHFFIARLISRYLFGKKYEKKNEEVNKS